MPPRFAVTTGNRVTDSRPAGFLAPHSASRSTSLPFSLRHHGNAGAPDPLPGSDGRGVTAAPQRASPQDPRAALRPCPCGPFLPGGRARSAASSILPAAAEARPPRPAPPRVLTCAAGSLRAALRAPAQPPLCAPRRACAAAGPARAWGSARHSQWAGPGLGTSLGAGGAAPPPAPSGGRVPAARAKGAARPAAAGGCNAPRRGTGRGGAATPGREAAGQRLM